MITRATVILRILMAYGVGIVLGKYLPIPPLTPVMLFLVYLSLCYTIRPVATVHRCMMLLLLCSLGALNIQVTLTNPIKSYGEVTYVGSIAYQPDRKAQWYSSESSGYLGDTPVKIILKAKRPQSYIYGDHVRVTGELKPPQAQRNPGGFDYRAYLANRRIHGLLEIKTIEKVGHSSYLVPNLTLTLRKYIQSRLDKSEYNHLLRAMVLGERRGLDTETVDLFQKTGNAHMLAVSGLHVGLIAAIFGFILLQFLPKHTAYAVTIIVVASYMLAVGLRPSVLRAGITCIIYLSARALGKKPDLEEILPLVAFGILLYNPAQLWDVGFQLSFSAIGAILWLMWRWNVTADKIAAMYEETHPLLGKTVRTVLTVYGITVCTQIGTFIFVAYYFHQIPLLSLIYSPLTTVLGSLTVLIAFMNVILSVIDPTIMPTIFNLSANIFLEVLASFRNDGLVWKIKTPSIYAILAFVTLLYLAREWAWHYIWHKTQMIACTTIVLFFWGAYAVETYFTERNILQITFIDVGQGDSIYVKLPNGKRFLVDAGNRFRNWDIGRRTVDPYLSHIGAFTLDAVVLTHPDTDHAGGLPHIISTFDVRSIIGATPGISENHSYRRLTNTLKETPRSVRAYPAHLSSLGTRVQIDVFNTNANNKAPNNNSLVIKLTYGNTRFLLTGDIEESAERALVNSGFDLRADIMQAPHHGSKTSSSPAFIQAVSPTFAVISCGEDNRYGHPHISVLDNYENAGVELLRTDKNGAITIRSNGTSVWIDKHIER